MENTKDDLITLDYMLKNGEEGIDDPVDEISFVEYHLGGIRCNVKYTIGKRSYSVTATAETAFDALQAAMKLPRIKN